jgi:hypothetical protein
LDALLFLGNLLADTEVFGQRTRWTYFRNAQITNFVRLVS